ncbi:uncharacterized protein LOC108243447 [Kryptolebias marmoratus]|uniref:uncharacterized protein LOC108243447 n=1 Tax=Kryptolebias marmoratus TaxID=37003 RepID=UPI0007F8E567|nr:uncharacterized protein LOC108243447 [Kryptolebias marmoratus]XP_024864497.1 uncharacterized protein LOC108243447 [Kryptolebias marmoratus]
MPAGFLITRLLLVYLLQKVDYNSIFATAQPAAQAWHVARGPYDYLPNLPLQHVTHERQPQVGHNNPWAKLVEGFIRSRNHPEANYHPSLHQQIQNPYHPQILIKNPYERLSSKLPALEPKKIEFNVNIPFQHLVKGLALTKKGYDWFREIRDGDHSHRMNQGIAGPFWSDHRGLPKDMLKRKPTQGGGNQGVNFRFSAPFPSYRETPNLQRPENLGFFFSPSELATHSSPEFGLERPIPHHDLGLNHPYFGPAHVPQMAPPGCLFADQVQVYPGQHQTQEQQHDEKQTQQQVLQKLQPQLPIFRQMFNTGHHNPSAGKLWTEEISKQLPQIQVSIGNPNHDPEEHPKKEVEAPEQKPPESSGAVFPRLGCRSPEVQNKPHKQWLLCPRVFRWPQT